MKTAQVKMIISGRVQGVFYRHSTREKARDLGLSGWVRNVDDGSVEVLAVGPVGMIEELITWCRSGPPGAVVDKVQVAWLEPDESFADVYPASKVQPQANGIEGEPAPFARPASGAVDARQSDEERAGRFGRSGSSDSSGTGASGNETKFKGTFEIR